MITRRPSSPRGAGRARHDSDDDGDEGSVEQRLLKFKGQVNALAEAWIGLARLVEKQDEAGVAALKDELRRRRWPNYPQFNAEARETLRFLCDALDESRTDSASAGEDLRDGRGDDLSDDSPKTQ